KVHCEFIDDVNDPKTRGVIDQDDAVVLEDDKEKDREEDKTEPVEVQEVVDVVTTAKLITEVVTDASETVTAANAIITTAEAQVPTATLIAAPTRVAAAPSRRSKGVVIRDPEEESTTFTIIPAKTKSKDKERAAKRRKLDEEVEELKRHLQIIPNEDDDVYIEATPLARKVPVVDYQIIEINNKPYYKIIRADDTHQLYISFLTLLRNFDREDLEALWSLVKERFSTTKPKNFSDDFLLVTLRAMFEKPDIHAQIWKNQRTVHGPANVKGWKLLESYGVQIITFRSTQLILLVERKYPLTRFTRDQMLNANVAGFKMDYFKGMSYDDIRPIFEAKFNSNRAAKRRKLDEEVEELKRHLQIIPNEDDDVYIEATPLARKVPVVDYQIIEINNKPYYKIIRADDTHQLYISFLTLLRNFDREDLEALWSLVKERFSTTKPKNFSDDFLLVTLRAMFEKPDIHAQIWKNQRTVHGPANVKGWKLLESYGVQIITFRSTQLILLVERKYPLTRFTRDQMLNAVRLEVEEESEVSLELLRFTRQQHQEGQIE
nr:hypothetical protein [Tanacetum cinerariifolium]